MNSYKGFTYPTVRDFYADEEKYTYEKDENKWAYVREELISSLIKT